MSVHPLFTTSRPALAPMLFARSLDGLLHNRQETLRIAAYSVHQTRHRYSFAARQIAWADRLSARIAELTA